ncbi:ribonuclease T2 family protein [Erythrobacter litoralis]|uniref:Ribonuclease T2 family protein n=1 Tax=Erythrobacter litoralis (strain HTCC2594) TaxID=314225 RepID=Q2N6R4_ERYLH|nr:ribonuclease T [Erythrobacter litoralis]ABC64627.1 ribonuclease T2 family protein [Erythrobacter litoralis HTCC2594]
MTGLLMGSAAPGLAQSYQCRVSGNLLVPEQRQDGPTRQLPVTGYTLALSWSPEFCRTRQSSRRDATQCSGRTGRFGLIVHGLWPDGRDIWPQYCGTARTVSVPEAKRNLCMMPSPRLMARQWQKHGSCMARRPETYFKVTRILWNSLRIPDYDRLSRQDNLTAGDIRCAFASANGTHWQPEMVGVKLNERGWLQELRLCYGKNFMPVRCKPRQLGVRDNIEAKIWRGL